MINGTVHKVESLGDGSVKLAVYVPLEIAKQHDLLKLQFEEIELTKKGESPESTVTHSRDESLHALVDQGERLVAAHSELVSMVKVELDRELLPSVDEGDATGKHGTCYNNDCDFHSSVNGCTDNPPYSCEMHQPEPRIEESE
jgi:hypothetical protein